MRRSPLRVRLAGAAMLVIALAGTLGGLAGVRVLRQSLVAEVDRAVLARAEVLVGANSGEFVNLGAFVAGDEVAALVDPFTEVADFAEPADLDVDAVLDAGSIGDELRLDEPFSATLAGGVEHRLTIAAFADDFGIDFLLIVGSSLAPVQRTVADVARILAAAVPLLTLLVGALVWTLTGRSLRSVEALRRQVDDVSAVRVDGRVSPPGTAAELDRLAGTLNGLLDRIQAARDGQARFVADASHELRTPLAALLLQLEVAQRPGGAAVDPGELARQVTRLGTLVDDLLTLARLDAGDRVRIGELVDLDERVRTGCALVPSRDGVGVDRRGLAAVQVRGDGAAIERVVVNLVANAVRHARRHVRVTLQTERDEALLVVEDDGPGVPEDQRDRVLQRFVRLDDARASDAGGSGLGLAICDEIVRAHGGTLRVEQRVGRGADGTARPRRGARLEARLPLA